MLILKPILKPILYGECSEKRKHRCGRISQEVTAVQAKENVATPIKVTELGIDVSEQAREIFRK